MIDTLFSALSDVVRSVLTDAAVFFKILVLAGGIVNFAGLW